MKTQRFTFATGWHCAAGLAMSFVCLLGSGVRAQMPGMKGAPEKGSVYANVDQLQCGTQRVVVVSSCIARDADNSDPFCFHQNVTFLSEKGEAVQSHQFRYLSSSNSFVRGAACLANRSDYFVELSSSNLGNCNHCEWTDYFKSSGEYIASSPTPKGERALSRRQLTKVQAELIRSAQSVEKIELTTVAR